MTTPTYAIWTHTHCLCRPEVSLQGYLGDLFRIRGFSPITGLISFFSRPLSIFPLCFTTDFLLTSWNLSYSLSCFSSTFFLLGKASHIYCFKSSYVLYSHTPDLLCDTEFLIALAGKCNVAESKEMMGTSPPVCFASLWPRVLWDIVIKHSRGR